MTINAKIATMRSWILRREQANKNWTANELWVRIKTNWPTISEDDQERIFQECDGNARRRSSFNVEGTITGRLPGTTKSWKRMARSEKQ